MKLTYSHNGVLLVNGVHLTKTQIRYLPAMVGIEIIKLHGTNVIIRDLATRLWYYISIPRNKSWNHITLKQFNTFPVKVTNIKGISYLINLDRKPQIEII